jgi:uncharacterized membrane-anchored protein
VKVLVRKGLIVAALHVALVSSLGAKLLLDRATQPRVWVRTAPYDPNLPIRGRYVRLRIEVGTDGQEPAGPVELSVRNVQLVAMPASDSTGLYVQDVQRGGRSVTVLSQPLAYFIPEHVPDPSIRNAGEELWVEVTVPKRGAPRPIQLGVKKDEVLIPLELR